jgi:hypothetical protein
VAINTPLVEDNPRLPEPWASTIFYYTQYDLLKKLSHGKSWTFTEIRPDGIVGFTAVSNPMNMAQGMAIYLALYREVKGKGSEVPYPGSEVGYRSSHSDTFQDILAKMEIHAALHPEKCGNGRAFNIADGATVSWAQIWPKLCEHWGLIGKGPDEGATPMLDFVSQNRDAWVTLAKRHDLDERLIDQQGWNHLHMMLVTFDFDRQYDLSRAREAGFLEEIDTVHGYIMSWERMRSAKQIPPQ